MHADVNSIEPASTQLITKNKKEEDEVPSQLEFRFGKKGLIDFEEKEKEKNRKKKKKKKKKKDFRQK
jgi:hypothetical protein